ncbi:MAG TPA: hypothetical protein VFX28_20010, partial [Methylomirabilota bacterium]|nr:hypothetical protein [Methylomirabilota bacterium]
MSMNGWRVHGEPGDRPLWRNAAFWLVLGALILPFGWLLLLYGAGRYLRRSAAHQRPTTSLLPRDYAEWLRLRDDRR